MKHRFQIIEYSSYYAVRDRETSQERPMGDGVDTLFTSNFKAMIPGSEYFRKTWQRMLNDTPNETLEAYFPETYTAEIS